MSGNILIDAVRIPTCLLMSILFLENCGEQFKKKTAQFCRGGSASITSFLVVYLDLRSYALGGNIGTVKSRKTVLPPALWKASSVIG